MYVITKKENHEIYGFDERLEYWSNGYPVLMPQNMAYVASSVYVNEVDSIPDYVKPAQHCYTEADGFYENPDYIPPSENPYGISDKLLRRIQEDTAAQVMADVAAKGVTAGE